MLQRKLRAANARIAELEAELKSREPQVNGVASIDVASLTKRERQVAELFQLFASEKRVAAELGIALQTVRNHIASIEHKLGAGSRDELIVLLIGGRTHQKSPTG